MNRLFTEWSEQIKQYCDSNGLSFTKLCTMGQCWNKTSILFGYHDKAKGKQGLLDDTPAPCVLEVFMNTDGKLEFKQTKYTKIYLTEDEIMRRENG